MFHYNKPSCLLLTCPVSKIECLFTFPTKEYATESIHVHIHVFVTLSCEIFNKSSKEAQVEILTSCSICFETFNIPKYLPCLHSFCAGCLQTYITSAFRVNSACKGIDCPVCRTFVQKPDSVNVEEWAKDFPSNHLLVSIIDMNKAKSESRCCNSCSRADKTVNATSWCVNCCEMLCETCTQYHRIHKQSSQHKVIDIADIKDIESPLQHTDMYCHEHTGKKLKAYCFDHSVVCCMTCVMLTHRKCDNVQSVEKAIESKKYSEDYKRLEESFTDMKTSGVAR